MTLPIFQDDPSLHAVKEDIFLRVNEYKAIKHEIEKKEGSILNFAEGYKQFGFNRVPSEKKWTYTEWLPNAKQVFLIGDFNKWENVTPLKDTGFGRWQCDLPDRPNGEHCIAHKCQLKVRLETQDGQWLDRVPAWTKLAWQDASTNLFNGVFWEPPESERYVFKHPRPPKPEGLKIYEAHVGMGTADPKVGTYTEFKDIVLPRIKRLGYNAVQLMAIAEHSYYGSFGYHVTSFFAPASRSGTPDELKEMVDTAHAMGITVLMDLVHAHCSSNAMDGIAQMDGTDHCYTHGGAKGYHSEWDSCLFHYSKWEVMRFLLSNCRWWLEVFGFDGFRFDGVTSMLYHSHGIGRGFSGGYHEYFSLDSDVEAQVYLMLANDVVHTLLPKSGVSVGEDVSGMPTLGRPVEEGGFGFDYRLAMALPDMYIKMLKEQTDDHQWDMGHVVHTLQNRRYKEKVVAYAESHDQAIVGDKTIAFWLMDATMYTHMSTLSEPNMVVDRGLALHKMLRLLTLGLGGEGYLSFIGNEFGHPEWVDFPREGNDWSYQHCRRRWDLPDTDHLKYKFFEKFDELMHACENRFKFVASQEQYCSKQDNMDKVIVFERGPCVFVLNFHPTNSYSDYLVGHQHNEGMRIVLDTDEERFGGFKRLEYGHNNSFPPLGGCDCRYHSCKLYVPSRTAQVLVKESKLKGGISVIADTDRKWPGPINDMLLELHETWPPTPGMKTDDKQKNGGYVNGSMPVASKNVMKLDSKGTFKMDSFSATFSVFWETKQGRQYLSGGPFKIDFPGKYILTGADKSANLVVLGDHDADVSLTDISGDCVPGSADAFEELTRNLSKEPSAAAKNFEEADTDSACNVPPSIGAFEELTRHLSKEPPAAAKNCDDADTDGACNDEDASKTKNVPPSIIASQTADENMAEDKNSGSDLPTGSMMKNISSFSCMDSLITEAEEIQDLRSQIEEMAIKKPKGYEAKNTSRPIVVVASEVNPWSKTGGLAMVAGSYAYEFAMNGHRVMCISPRYENWPNMNHVGWTKVWLNGQEHEVQYFHQYKDYGDGKGCDYIFVDHNSYHRPAGLYWDPQQGREYDDNLFRFALLSLAAAEAPLILKLGGLPPYGQDVLFIANDWQTGLLPVYLHYKYQKNNTYLNARSLFVIHNMGYQGKYRMSKFPVEDHLGLPSQATEDLQGEDLNMKTDCMNLLAAAVRTCDRVLTVSPNYANEIQSPDGGFGLHELLQAKGAALRVAGILNGISDEWSPVSDPHIPRNYGPKNFGEMKPICKSELQKQLGLHQDPNVALLGFCGRLCYQKGVHLITQCLDWLMHDTGNGVTGRVQLILMGKGDLEYSRQLADAENRYKGRVCGYVGFDPKVEHQMMAGCDFLLMPSQYEPCGLPQMYAQQYGTLPIVHETGGLKDSVKGLWDVDRDRTSATGFLFGSFEENALKERMYQALDVFQKNKPLFQQMQENAIRSDYYWPRALEEYEKHIDYTIADPRCRQ